MICANWCYARCVLNVSLNFSIFSGGYNSLLTPMHRRFSYAGSYRKSNSVESSRVFCAYPIDESFDYFMGSDGEEADDEFDQITSSNDVDDRAKRSQHFSQKTPPQVNAINATSVSHARTV